MRRVIVQNIRSCVNCAVLLTPTVAAATITPMEVGLGIITLLTDFGTQDGYVGTMRGVILSINAGATIVDIGHDIPPHDVPAAAFVLSAAYPYFTEDSIHVVVVDPGVGSARRGLAVRTPGGTFVAPDNGVLSYVYARESSYEAVELTERRFWLSPVSQTFHGRDVFAPVAAHLSLGVPFAELGPPIGDPQRFVVPQPELRADGTVEGQILHVDRFGNLITNVSPHMLPADKVIIHIADQPIRGLLPAYAKVPDGELLALVGSHGYVEIAVRNGSAAQVTGVCRGTKLLIHAAREVP
jgi:S-adenosylmethionine hydrolase